jgi:hypothetical protein
MPGQIVPSTSFMVKIPDFPRSHSAAITAPVAKPVRPKAS